jgi:hypothetical protein
MLPVKISPSKETRRRTALNGVDGGDAEYGHNSNDSSPQKGLLSHSHYPSPDKPLVRVPSAPPMRGMCHLTLHHHHGKR